MKYPKIDFKKIDPFKEITSDGEDFHLIREELSLIMSKLENETEPIIQTQEIDNNAISFVSDNI